MQIFYVQFDYSYSTEWKRLLVVLCVLKVKKDFRNWLPTLSNLGKKEDFKNRCIGISDVKVQTLYAFMNDVHSSYFCAK